MSPKRKALDTERIHKALDRDQEALRRNENMQKLSIEKDSLLERTERLTIDEGTLTSENSGYVETVLNDYQSDLKDLEESIREYRLYLRKLREKEWMGD